MLRTVQSNRRVAVRSCPAASSPISRCCCFSQSVNNGSSERSLSTHCTIFRNKNESRRWFTSEATNRSRVIRWAAISAGSTSLIVRTRSGTLAGLSSGDCSCHRFRWYAICCRALSAFRSTSLCSKPNASAKWSCWDEAWTCLCRWAWISRTLPASSLQPINVNSEAVKRSRGVTSR